MSLLPNEMARRAGRQIEFLADPLRVRIGPVSVQAADGHDLLLTMHCTAMTRSQTADRQLFIELLLAQRDAVSAADVGEFLTPALGSAAESLRTVPVAEALSEKSRHALLAALPAALDAAAFAAGFIVLPPFQLELRSESLEREHRQAAERARLADRAAAQLLGLRHAADVLRQFDSLRADAPNAPAGQLLERLSAADRAAVLRSTLAARAVTAKPRRIVAVAGLQWMIVQPSSAVVGEPPALAPPAQRFDLPETLGPLRSVRSVLIDERPRLLVGARGGVWIVDPTNAAPPTPYADRALQSPLGFNSAVALPDGALLATHGEGGLVRWRLGQGDAPEARLRPDALSPDVGSGPRILQNLDDHRAIVAIGSSVVIVTDGRPDRIAGVSNRPIVNVLPIGSDMLIVHEDGAIGRFDASSGAISRMASVAGNVSSAAALPWVDDVRLLLARDGGLLDCVGLDDSVVIRFSPGSADASTGSGPLRAACASESLVAAMSNDRQRILAWSLADPSPNESTIASLNIHVPSLMKHRVADLCLIG